MHGYPAQMSGCTHALFFSVLFPGNSHLPASFAPSPCGDEDLAFLSIVAQVTLLINNQNLKP